MESSAEHFLNSPSAADSHLMGAQLGWNQSAEHFLNSQYAADSHLMGVQLG